MDCDDYFWKSVLWPKFVNKFTFLLEIGCVYIDQFHKVEFSILVKNFLP